ncbi:MAG: GIY-YIG nuclease family protein [Rhodocyclaceae bacterium]|nr:GIY-YIG nuclease family protein [Rhodocyclaceae bacterium]
MSENAPPCWVLYLLECQGADTATTLYTGITTDLERRFNEHLAGVGARYTRSHPPLRVLAIREFADRADASRAEAVVKKLPRHSKLAYFV